MNLNPKAMLQAGKPEKTVKTGLKRPYNGLKTDVKTAEVHLLPVKTGLKRGKNGQYKQRIEAFKSQREVSKAATKRSSDIDVIKNVLTSENGLQVCSESTDDGVLLDDLIDGLFVIIEAYNAGQNVAIDATIKQLATDYPNDDYPNITLSFLLKKVKPVLYSFGLIIKPSEKTSQWIDSDGLAELSILYPVATKNSYSFNPVAWLNKKRTDYLNSRLEKKAATDPYIKRLPDGSLQQLPKYGEAELSEKDKKLMRDLDKEKARAALLAEIETYKNKSMTKELTDKQAKHYREMMQLEHDSQTKALVLRTESNYNNQIRQQRLIDNVGQAMKIGFILLVVFIVYKVIASPSDIQPIQDSVQAWGISHD